MTDIAVEHGGGESFGQIVVRLENKIAELEEEKGNLQLKVVELEESNGRHTLCLKWDILTGMISKILRHLVRQFVCVPSIKAFQGVPLRKY